MRGERERRRGGEERRETGKRREGRGERREKGEGENWGRKRGIFALELAQSVLLAQGYSAN